MSDDELLKHAEELRELLKDYKPDASGPLSAFLQPALPTGSKPITAEQIHKMMRATSVCDRCHGERHTPGAELSEYDGVAPGGRGLYCHYCLGEFRMEE